MNEERETIPVSLGRWPSPVAAGSELETLATHLLHTYIHTTHERERER